MAAGVEHRTDCQCLGELFRGRAVSINIQSLASAPISSLLFAHSFEGIMNSQFMGKPNHRKAFTLVTLLAIAVDDSSHIPHR